jgi:hypothetical protein
MSPPSFGYNKEKKIRTYLRKICDIFQQKANIIYQQINISGGFEA